MQERICVFGVSRFAPLQRCVCWTPLLLALHSGCKRERSEPSLRQTAPSAAPSAGIAKPAAPAISLQGRALAFISNEGSNTVSVLDTSTDELITSVPVGKRPRGMRLARDRRTLFVALTGSPRGGPGIDESKLPPPNRADDGIGVVDLERVRLVSTLPSGPDPESFDIASDGASLYVSNEDAASISILDVQAHKLAGSVSVGGEPEGVTLSPDGRFAYVACEADNRVDVIDTARRARIRSIPTKARPRSILFTRDGATAYAAAELGGVIEVLDARRHAHKASIPLAAAGDAGANAPRPMGLALSPDERTLYVSTGRAGSIAVIDTASRKRTREFTGVGSRPWGIALSADGRKLYSANGPSDDVSVIDTESGAILQRVPTGRLPWGVVLSDTP
jgi:YVTN family beta-propeller protein